MYKKTPSTRLRSLSALALALGTSLSQGGIIIDDFSDVNPGTTVEVIVENNAPPSTDTIDQTGLTNVIGGERRLSVERVAETGAGSRTVQAQIMEGAADILQFTSGNDATGNATLEYGFDVDLNADLSATDTIVIDFAGFDVPLGQPLNATLTVESGRNNPPAGSGMGSQTLAANGGILSYTFADAGFASVDFTDVDFIRVVFEAPEAADFQVNGIEAIRTTPVPEISSNLALSSLFLLGLLARRR